MKRTAWSVLVIVGSIAATWKVLEVRAKQAAEADRLSVARQEAERLGREESERQEALRVSEEKRRAYMSLVSQAAFGHLSASAKGVADPVEFAEEKERLSRIYLAQIGEPPPSAKLAGIWTSMRKDAGLGLLALYKIAALDHPQHSGWEAIQPLLRASGNAAGAAPDKSELQANFREAAAGLDRALPRLVATLSDLGLPDAADALKIVYFPAWRGAFAAESVELRNNSGHDLREVLLFVTVKGRTGTIVTHLHYLEAWPAGSPLTAHYTYGQRDYLNSQALEDPSGVEVAALTQAGIFRGSYEFAQPEYDNRIKGYLATVKFAGSYLSPSPEQGPGFQLLYSGLQRLPVRAATIRFSSEGKYEDVPWNLPPLKPGETYPVRTTSTAQPESAQLTLWFEDTNISVTIPSGGPARIN